MSPRATHCPNRIVAGHANSSGGQRIGKHHTTHETKAPNQIVVAVDMTVERGLADIEFLGHTGQAYLVDTLTISDFGCGMNDQLFVDWAATSIRICSC